MKLQCSENNLFVRASTQLCRFLELWHSCRENTQTPALMRVGRLPCFASGIGNSLPKLSVAKRNNCGRLRSTKHSSARLNHGQIVQILPMVSGDGPRYRISVVDDTSLIDGSSICPSSRQHHFLFFHLSSQVRFAAVHHVPDMRLSASELATSKTMRGQDFCLCQSPNTES